MFLIIPAIVIFLAFSYLHLNENVSMFLEVSIYIFIISVISFSLYIYKAIRKNLKQQELNKILLEIHQLEQKLKRTNQENEQETINLQIKKLQEESKTFF